MATKADQLVSEAHHEFLKDVVKKTGAKPTRIAEEIGVSPSTLTRMLGGNYNGKSTLRATTLAKLASFSGLPQPQLAPEDSGAEPAQGFFEDATPYKMETGDAEVTAAIRAIVGTRKNIEPWTLKTRSLELAGFLPGDIVLVDLNTTGWAGDAVCAQVYDWRKKQAETIMRIHQPPYLEAFTGDPAIKRTLLVDNDQVIVKGLILPHRLRARRQYVRFT